MGARNWVGIRLSHRPNRLHRLAESIPGVLKSLQISSLVSAWVQFSFSRMASTEYKLCEQMWKSVQTCSVQRKTIAVAAQQRLWYYQVACILTLHANAGVTFTIIILWKNLLGFCSLKYSIFFSCWNKEAFAQKRNNKEVLSHTLTFFRGDLKKSYPWLIPSRTYT
jgi:hypothetical protein